MTTRNVVLITVDSLREDTFDEMRDEVLSHTSTLAECGTEFTQAISNGPNTPSSFPSILTGTHPLMYGGYDYLDGRRPFLSTTLKNKGFTTVGYHSNPHLGTNRNYNHGFDVFNNGEEDRNDASTLVNFIDENLDSDSLLYSLLRRGWHLLGSTAGVSAYDRAKPITDNALHWFEAWNGDRFFMWLHYMDVHYPFQPPAEHLEAIGQEPLSARRVANLNDAMEESPESLTEQDVADLKALYRGELHYVDHNVGRVLDALTEEGIRDETMVVFTADHGEAFGEHGRWGHHPYMYDELLRVPLLVDEPGRDPRTDDTQVSLIDLFPTICDACGVERPTKLQGESLYEKESGVELGTSKGGKRLAARTADWKCLWNLERNEIELYDLDADPGETRDVHDEHPDVVDRLRNEMEDYRETARSTDTDLPEVEESDAVKQRLRDLGYTE